MPDIESASFSRHNGQLGGPLDASMYFREPVKACHKAHAPLHCRPRAVEPDADPPFKLSREVDMDSCVLGLSVAAAAVVASASVAAQTITDGDTIKFNGTTYRLWGFDARTRGSAGVRRQLGGGP